MEITLLTDELQQRCVHAIVNKIGMSDTNDSSYRFGFYVDAFCEPEPRKFYCTVTVDNLQDLNIIRDIAPSGTILNEEGTAPTHLFAGKTDQNEVRLVVCEVVESWKSDVEWEFQF